VRSIMTASATACLAILLLCGMSTDEGTSASAPNSEAHESGGIAIEQIIAIVARKTGKKYLVDPRVRAQVHLIGEEPSSITYSELQLVPILRPLLPQFAQLAAYPCTNSLLISDHFENVKRIEAIVKALDVGTPYKYDKCEGTSASNHGGDNPPRRD